MKGVSRVKKFGSKMKTYAQALGVKQIENNSKKDKMNLVNQNKKKEESQKEQKEISKLNETINGLQKQVNELIKLINEIVQDKYKENELQRSAIN